MTSWLFRIDERVYDLGVVKETVLRVAAITERLDATDKDLYRRIAEIEPTVKSNTDWRAQVAQDLLARGERIATIESDLKSHEGIDSERWSEIRDRLGRMENHTSELMNAIHAMEGPQKDSRGSRDRKVD